MNYGILLTSATPTGAAGSEPVELLEVVEGTLSNVTIGGVIVARITCILVGAAAGFIAYKWRGNAGGDRLCSDGHSPDNVLS